MLHKGLRIEAGMTKNKIKVIITDDHAILRAGLKQILAETDNITVLVKRRMRLKPSNWAAHLMPM